MGFQTCAPSHHPTWWRTALSSPRIRVLDMRASPYDLTALGYSPVRIETPEGRAEYESLQRDFARMAAPLRQRLQAACETIIESWTTHEAMRPRPTCLGAVA